MSKKVKMKMKVDYDSASKALDALLDIVGTDESHPLYEILDALGEGIKKWEDDNLPE